jgi:hypothetical protein
MTVATFVNAKWGTGITVIRGVIFNRHEFSSIRTAAFILDT